MIRSAERRFPLLRKSFLFPSAVEGVRGARSAGPDNRQRLTKSNEIVPIQPGRRQSWNAAPVLLPQQGAANRRGDGPLHRVPIPQR